MKIKWLYCIEIEGIELCWNERFPGAKARRLSRAASASDLSVSRGVRERTQLAVRLIRLIEDARYRRHARSRVGLYDSGDPPRPRQTNSPTYPSH